jgi:hypothetical protein
MEPDRGFAFPAHLGPDQPNHGGDRNKLAIHVGRAVAVIGEEIA